MALTGGAKIEAYLSTAGKRLAQPETVEVGFLENATYEDGTPVAMIAAIQNFGAPSRGIPPRPFFSNMVADKSPSWGQTLAARLKARDMDAHAALTDMGEEIAGQLRQSIVDTNEPPLKPATIARKGSDKPLVDTGHMLGRVDYRVIDGLKDGGS